LAAPVEALRAAWQPLRIDREIGRGGMATVYLAEDLRHGRQCALKVLDPELLPRSARSIPARDPDVARSPIRHPARA